MFYCFCSVDVCRFFFPTINKFIFKGVGLVIVSSLEFGLKNCNAFFLVLLLILLILIIMVFLKLCVISIEV